MNREAKALKACVEVVSAKNEVKRLTEVIGNSLSLCEESPHLKQAYAYEERCEGDRKYLPELAQLLVLQACPHCLTAHYAIQDRKAAKKRLSSARRAITIIGSDS